MFLANSEWKEPLVEALGYARKVLNPKSRCWSVPEEIQTDNTLILEFYSMCHTKGDILKEQIIRQKVIKKLYNLKVRQCSCYKV